MTIEEIRRFAEKQDDIANETGNCDDCIGVDDGYGMFVINPFRSSDAMQIFTEDEAKEYWGESVFNEFCKAVEDSML